MPKMFKIIALPLQLIKQEQFAKKIAEIDENISQNIQNLKKYIQNNHQICLNSAKQLNKLIQSTLKRLQSPHQYHQSSSPSNYNITNSHNLPMEKLHREHHREEQSFARFLNNFYQISQCMENQISKINIFMKSKKYENIRRMNQTINAKLEKIGDSVGLFIGMAREYNVLGEKYTRKAEYFRDIDKNAIRYYSYEKNQEKYSQVIKMQQELQLKLDSITTLKSEIYVMMLQLTTKISELYEKFRSKIDEFRRVALLFLEKVIQLIKGFQKIEQASQDAQQSQILSKKQKENQQLINQQYALTIQQTRRSLPLQHPQKPLKQQLKHLKKHTQAHHLQSLHFQSQLLSFLSSFHQTIHRTIVELSQLRTEKHFNKLINQLALMAQLLPPSCMQDIEMIVQVQDVLVGVFGGIQQIVSMVIFEELFKRRGIYYMRFLQELEKVSEMVSLAGDIPVQEQIRILANIEAKEKKYIIEIMEWKKELDNRFKEMIVRIQNQFLKKGGKIKDYEKADKKSQLFLQKNFQILKCQFFNQNKILGPFQKNQSIINYQKITKSDRIKNLLFQLQTEGRNDMQIIQDRNEGKSTRNLNRVQTTSCCGLFRNKNSQQKNPKLRKSRNKNKNQQMLLLQKIKKSKKIQTYSCALKDGFMLFQGKMTLYIEYLRFKSSFNPNTFFGSTDIFIPKHDIHQIIKGRHIMSQLITIVTKKGSIQFTSFFSNPFQLLLQTYLQHGNTTLNQHQLFGPSPNLNPSPTSNQFQPLHDKPLNHQYSPHLFKDKDRQYEQSQLEELKFKMKTQFLELALKEGFKVYDVKVMDYDSMIQIQYSYYDISRGLIANRDGVRSSLSRNLQINIPMTFKASIKHFQNSLQYAFWHCQSQTLQRKKKLQSIAKNLINQDRMQKIDNFRQLKLREKQRQKDYQFDGSSKKHAKPRQGFFKFGSKSDSLLNLQGHDNIADDNISFSLEQQLSIIGPKQKHRLDLGQQVSKLNFSKGDSFNFNRPPINTNGVQYDPIKKKLSNIDLHMLLQQNQTKNSSFYSSPKSSGRIDGNGNANWEADENGDYVDVTNVNMVNNGNKGYNIQSKGYQPTKTSNFKQATLQSPLPQSPQIHTLKNNLYPQPHPTSFKLLQQQQQVELQSPRLNNQANLQMKKGKNRVLDGVSESRNRKGGYGDRGRDSYRQREKEKSFDISSNASTVKYQYLNQPRSPTSPSTPHKQAQKTPEPQGQQLQSKSNLQGQLTQQQRKKQIQLNNEKLKNVLIIVAIVYLVVSILGFLY